MVAKLCEATTEGKTTELWEEIGVLDRRRPSRMGRAENGARAAADGGLNFSGVRAPGKTREHVSNNRTINPSKASKWAESGTGSSLDFGEVDSDLASGSWP